MIRLSSSITSFLQHFYWHRPRLPGVEPWGTVDHDSLRSVRCEWIFEHRWMCSLLLFEKQKKRQVLTSSSLLSMIYHICPLICFL